MNKYKLIKYIYFVAAKAVVLNSSRNLRAAPE